MLRDMKILEFNQAAELEEAVMKKMKEGWLFHGQMVVVQTPGEHYPYKYIQAMVLPPIQQGFGPTADPSKTAEPPE